ncbi:hypothetical protein ACFY3G_17855 [Streptomyces phaeochromogenes]|uniref:hypothetical protein n=1 Tax=Streptomyces phaeochromogenes TaxID=1923 RepID=UPI0036AF3369
MSIQTSAVPDALDQLLVILRTGIDPNTLAVFDGPTLNDTPDDCLFVGWQPSGEASVNIQQDFAYAGARRRKEVFEVQGYIETKSGDTDMQARRARAFEILGLVATALRATDAAPEAPTLNGTVLWAHLTAGDLLQEQNSNGATCGLAFSVTCQALI